MITIRPLLLVGALLTLSMPLAAQDAKPAPQRSSQPAMRPQEGKLVAVDKTARTIAITPIEGVPSLFTGINVFQVRSNTFILKGGKKVKLEEATIGEKVRFNARKGEDGKYSLSWIVLSPPAPRRPADGGEKKN